MDVECLIIGGGAAGVAAAGEASSAGVEVVLVDEHKDLPGGPATGRGPSTPVLDPAVTVIGEAVAWGTLPGGLVSVVTPGDSLDLAPRTTIIATGAHDRLLPFAGWEHQSVVTANEALDLGRSLSAGLRWVLAGIGAYGAALARTLRGFGQQVLYVDAAGVGGVLLQSEMEGPPGWISHNRRDRHGAAAEESVHGRAAHGGCRRRVPRSRRRNGWH